MYCYIILLDLKTVIFIYIHFWKVFLKFFDLFEHIYIGSNIWCSKYIRAWITFHGKSIKRRKIGYFSTVFFSKSTQYVLLIKIDLFANHIILIKLKHVATAIGLMYEFIIYEQRNL